MKNLIFFIIIVLAGIVGYMYFFGKGEDRERAENVVNETKELGRSVADFIKRQKEKYDDGEFDRLFDRIGNTIDKLRKKPTENQEEVKQDLKELERELKKIDPNKLNEENRDRLKKLLQDLENELDEAG